MAYQIAGIVFEAPMDITIKDYLSELYEYANSSNPSINIDLHRFALPKDRIPQHEQNYSGFLTRKGREAGKPAFIFCFREGKLLYGMQPETNGAYNAYIHSQPFISAKTAVQYALLLEGCTRNMLGMHTVTVEYNGRVIQFSAPSGTGKTTHTELWRKELGAKILNGDFAFLECLPEQTRFHGTPFSESSIYAERGEWKVDDIVFLKQSRVNSIKRITKIAAATNAMENCFIPTWDEARTKLCLDLIGRMLKTTRVWQLECNMSPEAAHVAHDAIFGTEN